MLEGTGIWKEKDWMHWVVRGKQDVTMDDLIKV